MKKILFTGGGSAGHVIPNVALIEDLLKTGNVDVGYMGTDGIEKSILAPYKIPYMEISCPKLVRGGGFSALKRNIKIPFAFKRAMEQAKAHLLTFQPDLVFSKGGYVALPVVFAARKLKIPCFAHESDLSMGLANRLSAGKCEYVFTSFPETAEKIANGKYSGAPMRRSLLSADKKEAKKRFGAPERKKTLLIFGGGSGSAAINQAIRENLKTLTNKYFVLHVCGKGNIIETNFKNYLQTEFIADMGAAYACADGVIARSGAGTVFEILALQKPALFIPLEGQTRGDQKENAAYFERKGLCHVLSQNQLENLTDEVEKLFADKELKEKLSSGATLWGNDAILREIKRVLRI